MTDSKPKKENPITGSHDPETLRRIQEVMSKSTETLVLKNGRHIHGVIFQEGDRYLVFSAEGGFEFSADDVNCIEQ